MSDGRDAGIQQQAWYWANANRTPHGDLPSGKAIARRFGRSERWGRLVKQAGITGRLPDVEAAGLKIQASAAKLVLGEVRQKNRIRLRHAVADAGVIEIGDLDAVASWLELDPEDLRGQPLAFEDRFGTYVAAWPTTRRVAMRVAEVLGRDILKKMVKQEEALKYRRWEEPRYEHAKIDRESERLEALVSVLYEWCGSDDVERYDEVKALRGEVERLGGLVLRAVGELRQRKCHAIAATIENDLGVRASSLRGRYR